jgi:hypothetical protein
VAVATSTEIQYLGYPIPAVGQSAPSAQQLLNVLPFEIDILLPSFIIHWNPNPEIGWWDTVLSFAMTLISKSSILYSCSDSKLVSCMPRSLWSHTVTLF